MFLSFKNIARGNTLGPLCLWQCFIWSYDHMIIWSLIISQIIIRAGEEVSEKTYVQRPFGVSQKIHLFLRVQASLWHFSLDRRRSWARNPGGLNFILWILLPQLALNLLQSSWGRIWGPGLLTTQNSSLISIFWFWIWTRLKVAVCQLGGIRFETSKLDLVRQGKHVVTDATFNEWRMKLNWVKSGNWNWDKTGCTLLLGFF